MCVDRAQEAATETSFAELSAREANMSILLSIIGHDLVVVVVRRIRISSERERENRWMLVIHSVVTARLHLLLPVMYICVRASDTRT